MKFLPKKMDIHLKGCYIAGGSILSTVTKTPIGDYDVYPKTNKDMMDAFHQLSDDGCFVVNVSDRAVSFKSNHLSNRDGERMIIQVMTYDTFETAEKIFDFFDFTVCMAAFDCDSNTYTFHPDFWGDVASKSIRFNTNTRYPLASMLRLTKYQAKGYHISKPEHIKVALAVAKKGVPTTWKELEEQIGGVYGRQVNLALTMRQANLDLAMTRDHDAKETEFTYEDCIDLLSNIGEFAFCDMYETDNMPRDISITDLTFMYDDSPKTGVMNSLGEIFMLDGGATYPNMHVGKVKPRNMTMIDSTSRFRGYKILVPDSDGVTLRPGIRKGTTVTYGIHQETTESRAPFLYVFPTIELAHKHLEIHYGRSKLPCNVYEVSYLGQEVRTANDREIQVTAMFVERQIKEGQEDRPTPEGDDDDDLL